MLSCRRVSGRLALSLRAAKQTVVDDVNRLLRRLWLFLYAIARKSRFLCAMIVILRRGAWEQLVVICACDNDVVYSGCQQIYDAYYDRGVP